MCCRTCSSPAFRIVFCGTAAGTVSAARGAYYAHPQNRFWSALHAIGLTPRLLQAGGLSRTAAMGLGPDRHRQACERHGPRTAAGRARRATPARRSRRRSQPPSRSGSRSRASPPGADISAAPPASASSPSASAEPASGSCLRHRRPPAGTGSATSTGGRRSQTRRGDRTRSPVRPGSTRRRLSPRVWR